MSEVTILVADDDRGIRTVLDQALQRAGYSVRTTGQTLKLWEWIKAGEGDLVITDVVMPDENGLDMIPRVRELRPDLPVVVTSARNTLLTAVRATERGAFEYLPKPFDLQEVVDVVGRGLAPALGGAEEPVAGVPDEDEQMPLIGRSPAMQDVYRVLARLVGTELTVMITGESGTGKELVARALHDYGSRRGGPFVAVNMAAIPRELIESELFGHEKGAFTGATHRQAGRFEQAGGGTLFLDEIGDMPLEAQTRLLRVLQEGEYTTVGGRTPLTADSRIVTATHQDLGELVRAGRFREDLYYRLNVVPLRLPPLRERVEDIPELARHFLNRCEHDGLPRKSLSADSLACLREHSWPGNVRELENLMRRLCALCSDEVIGASAVRGELSDGRAASPGAGPQTAGAQSLADAVGAHLRAYFDAHGDELPAAGVYDRVMREVERPLIALTLERMGGNQLRAAKLLGLNRNTLRKKIRELDIDIDTGNGAG